MQTQLIKVPYYCDNHNGWYEVPLSLANELNINLKSEYSFVHEREGFVYLDHDTDGEIFLRALRKNNVGYKLKICYEEFSRIHHKRRTMN